MRLSREEAQRISAEKLDAQETSKSSSLAVLLKKEGMSASEAVECLVDQALGSSEALRRIVRENKF